jgi:hypothetical protein
MLPHESESGVREIADRVIRYGCFLREHGSQRTRPRLAVCEFQRRIASDTCRRGRCARPASPASQTDNPAGVCSSSRKESCSSNSCNCIAHFRICRTAVAGRVPPSEDRTSTRTDDIRSTERFARRRRDNSRTGDSLDSESGRGTPHQATSPPESPRRAIRATPWSVWRSGFRRPSPPGWAGCARPGAESHLVEWDLPVGGARRVEYC